MKQGEPPPRGVKELVLKLAGEHPRPPNKQIRETVERTFGQEVKLSDRTIRRYCKAAGLPSGSLAAARLSQGDGNNIRDVELGPHRRELFHTAQHLRNYLAVPSIDGLLEPAIQTHMRDPDMAFWERTGGYRPMAFRGDQDPVEKQVSVGWRWGHRLVDQQPYIRQLRQHLRGQRCWRLLQTAVKATYDYEEAAWTTYKAISAELRARLPDVAQPDIEVLAFSLLKHGFYRAIGYAGAHFNCTSQKLDADQGSTSYRLILNGRATSSRDTEEALGPMSDAYQALAEQVETWEQLRTLGLSYPAAEKATSEFQECLNPDALLRKLLLNSRCELCP